MHHIFLCILFFSFNSYGSSIHKIKKHDGPPLFVCDIYDNGKPDKYFGKLLININKYYPLLTIEEISDCIKYCGKNPTTMDIIEQVQEFELWKAANLSSIKDKESCFKQYLQQCV